MFDWAAYKERLRQRWTNAAALPEPEGLAFVAALMRELDDRLRHESACDAARDAERSVRARLIAYALNLPDAFLGDFLQILGHAADAEKPRLGVASSAWLLELAAHAAFRSLNVDALPKPAELSTPGPQVHALPTVSATVAALATAGLRGHAVRAAGPGQLEGVFDLSHAQLGTDLPAALAARLYDMVFARDLSLRRGVPDAPLSDDERALLRNRFRDWRLARVGSAVYVRLPSQDPLQRQAVLGEVARLINHLVVSGETRDDESILLPGSDLTMAELRLVVDRLLQRMPEPAAAPASGPATSGAGGELPFDVFMCHATRDKAGFVDPLVKVLQGHGVKVWYDRERIPPGGNFVEGMGRGLGQSRFQVVLFSPNLLESDWASREIDSYLAMSRRLGRDSIVPLLLDVSDSQVCAWKPMLAPLNMKPVRADAIEGAAQLVLQALRAEVSPPG